MSPFEFLMLFASFPTQIFVISQSEARLPLQLEDAVRPDGEGEEVRMNVGRCTSSKILTTDTQMLFSPPNEKYWLTPKG